MNQGQTKGINEIIAERVAMVKCGACRGCQFCVSMTEEQTKEWEDEEFRWHPVALCAIQGNVNPIFFTREELDKGIHYRCNEGSWEETDDCFAYEPKAYDICDPVERAEKTERHRTYLAYLDKASRLQRQIQNVRSGEAEAELKAILDMIATGDFFYFERLGRYRLP